MAGSNQVPDMDKELENDIKLNIHMPHSDNEPKSLVPENDDGKAEFSYHDKPHRMALRMFLRRLDLVDGPASSDDKMQHQQVDEQVEKQQDSAVSEPKSSSTLSAEAHPPNLETSTARVEQSREESPTRSAVPAEPIENDYDFQKWTFTGGEYSTQRSVVSQCTFEDCHFSNVVFIGCKIHKTTFQSLDLENVAFVNVDFNNVEVYGREDLKLKHRNVLWANLKLQNAAISRWSWAAWPTDERSLTLRRPTLKRPLLKRPDPKRRLFSILGVTPPPRPSMAVIHEKSPDSLPGPDPELVEILGKRLEKTVNVAPSKRDLLSRLAEHDSIIDSVLRYCFPPVVHVYEYPRGFPIAKQKETYSVEDRNTLDGSRDRHTTAHFGSPHAVEPLDRANTMPYGPPYKDRESCHGLLMVNEIFRDLVPKYLYGRTFKLQCSARGAVQFLSDRRENQLKHIKEISIYYQFNQDRGTIETDDRDWHLLLTRIRHECYHVPKINVHISGHFWKIANWLRTQEERRLFREGSLGRSNKAYDVLGQKGLNNGSEDYPNLFHDVTKFAAPGVLRYRARDRVHRDHKDPCTEGQEVHVSIEGDKDGDEREVEDKRWFMSRLRTMIENRRQSRPFFKKEWRSPEDSVDPFDEYFGDVTYSICDERMTECAHLKPSK